MKPILPIIALSLILTGCHTQFPAEHQIANFDRVDAKVMRGAQPTRAALQWLSDNGCKAVVNLRAPGDGLPLERQTVEALGMIYLAFPMSGTHAPTADQMKGCQEAIAAVEGRVFVHCEFGCDRTGTVIACYRIRHGWTQALAEAEAVEFGLSPFNVGMKRFIERYRP